MSRAVLRQALVAAMVTASAGLLLVHFAYRPWGPSGRDIRIVSPPVEAPPSPGAGIDFAPLDEPRALPELRFADGDGRALSIADFRGRLVLLNIWATWCAPCLREMPTLDRLQAELGGTDFEVVALSIDRQGVPAVKTFYEELGLEALGVFVDRSTKVTRDLSVIGIPTTLLVDRQGREIGRVVGPAEWDSPEAVTLVRRNLERPWSGPGGRIPEQSYPRQHVRID